VTCETDASGQGITNLCSTIVLPPPGSPAEFANTVWLGCQRSNNIDKGLLSRSTSMGGQPFPADNFVGRSRNVFKASFHDIIRSIMVRVDLDSQAVEYIDIDDGGLVSGIGFSPDGETLVTHSKDQTVRRWKINPERLAEEICKVARRPLTQEEWQNYVGADIPYSEYEPCSR